MGRDDANAFGLSDPDSGFTLSWPTPRPRQHLPDILRLCMCVTLLASSKLGPHQARSYGHAR